MSNRRDCVRAKAESNSLVIIHPNLPSSEEEMPGPQRIYRCSLCPKIYLDQEDLEEHFDEVHVAPTAHFDINRQLMGGQRTSKIKKKLRAFRKKGGPFKSVKRLAEQRKNSEPISDDCTSEKVDNNEETQSEDKELPNAEGDSASPVEDKEKSVEKEECQEESHPPLETESPVEEEAEKPVEEAVEPVEEEEIIEKEKSPSPPPAPQPELTKNSSKELPVLKKQPKNPAVQVLVVKSAGNGTRKLMPYCPQCKNCFENMQILFSHQKTCEGPKKKNLNASWPTVDLTQEEATVTAPQDWNDAEMADCSQIQQSVVAPTANTEKDEDWAAAECDVSPQPVPAPKRLQLFRKNFKGKEAILSLENVDESRADMMPTKFMSDVTKCASCLAAFKGETALLWHRRRCHQQVDSWRHKCQFCARKFVSVGYLEQHLRLNHSTQLRRTKRMARDHSW